MVETVKKEPHLSKKTIQEIEDARKRIRAGTYCTEEEAKENLGRPQAQRL